LYIKLSSGVDAANAELEQTVQQMKSQLPLMDEFMIEDMMDDFGVSSLEELEARIEQSMRATHAEKIRSMGGAAQDYAQSMTPIVGTPVESLPKYSGSIFKDADDALERFAASLKQNPTQNLDQLGVIKESLLRMPGVDPARVNEIMAHAGLSQESMLPSLANDAGTAATAVIQSAKQVVNESLEDGLGFVDNLLTQKASRNHI
jgi:hypothetical protein